jgi:hypothetical protein
MSVIPELFKRPESASAELYEPSFAAGRWTVGSIAIAAVHKHPLSSFAELRSQVAVATTPPDLVTRRFSLAALPRIRNEANDE